MRASCLPGGAPLGGVKAGFQGLRQSGALAQQASPLGECGILSGGWRVQDH